MIKFLAALFMLIDHVGTVLFPRDYILSIIGRISMPLFAYCIARGFYYSEQKGTTGKYARKLLVFALVSQIPFTFMPGDGFVLNIGFTWLLAIAFLKALGMAVERSRAADPALAGKGNPSFAAWIIVLTVIILAALFVPMDYGLYGVLFPCVFWLFLFHRNKPQYVFLGMTVLYAFYGLTEESLIQVFSLAAWPVLLIAKRYDDKIKLNGRFFYWFYPAHIVVLLLLKGVFSL